MFRRGDQEEARQEPTRAETVEPHRTERRREPDESTVLGRGAKLEGNLLSSGSVQIDGELEGKIQVEGAVVLSDGSRVTADIEAQDVTVAGHYKGNIVAKDRAELSSRARVEGTISCRNLVVAEGAWFQGQLVMGNTSEPPTSSEAGGTAR